MQAIQSFGETGCRGLSSFFFNEKNVEALCENYISQYALALLGVGILGFALRETHFHYYHPGLLNGAKLGNLSAVKAEIAKGANLSVQDPLTGNTALHWALENGHFGVVKALVNAGAGLTAVNLKQETPLHSASKVNRPEAVALILTQKTADGALVINVNAKDSDGNNALMGASKRGYHRNVEELLKVPEIELNAQNAKNETALHLAASEYPEVLKLLLDAGANPDIEDTLGQFPLHRASANENVKGLELLLEKTVDCNHRDRDGNTALHLTDGTLASLLKSAPVLLASSKIDPNVRNNEGESALHSACQMTSTKPDLALLMIDSNRFNLNLLTEDDAKQTAAHIAAANGAEKVLKALVEKGADLSIPDGEGRSLLRVALEKRKLALLSSIIKPRSKEELEKMAIEGLSLIEWVTILCEPISEGILNGKGIYFAFNEANRARVLQKAQEIRCKNWKDNLSKLPIKVKEFREFIDDLENPLKSEQQQPEMVELFRKGMLNHLERRAIVAKYKKEGKHMPGAEFIAGGGTFNDLRWYFFSALPIFPEAVSEHILKIINKTEVGPDQAEIAALRQQVPQAFQYLFDREVSLIELQQHIPMLQGIIKANEATIMQALHQMPI